MKDLRQYMEFANKLADTSGSIIRKYYRNLETVDTKDDRSPVTVADRETEQSLRAIIERQFPEHGIQGEEFGIKNENAPLRWVLDPVDGTLSFTIGRPTFGTLIGLLENGEPIIGLIDQPIIHERWLAGKGEGTKLNNKPVKSKNPVALKDAVIATTGPSYYDKEGLNVLGKLQDASKSIVYGGDCYLYGLIATGQLDIAIDMGLKTHDFMPVINIIEESGGVITDWQGNKLTTESKGDVLVSSSLKLHKEALAALAA